MQFVRLQWQLTPNGQRLVGNRRRSTAGALWPPRPAGGECFLVHVLRRPAPHFLLVPRSQMHASNPGRPQSLGQVDGLTAMALRTMVLDLVLGIVLGCLLHQIHGNRLQT